MLRQLSWRVAIFVLMTAITTVMVVQAAKLPSAQVILQRARKVQQQPRDYVVEVTAKFDIPDVRIVPMRIKLSYKRPDQVHFESLDGFAFLPREGIMPWSEELERSLRQHAKMVVARETTIYGQTAYLIEVAPKSEIIPQPSITPQPRAFRHPTPTAPTQASAPTMRVWVERERWLIRRIETRSGPAHGEVRFDYQQVNGKYWLPKRVVAKAKWTGQPMSANLPGQQKNTRLPSRATITFDFSNYQVNVGLPASLFRKETPAPTSPVHPGHDPDEPR